jgi:hypothetical protein
MFAEECPYKVVRTNGSDEVLARAANLLIGRAAFETARRMYPKDLIEDLNLFTHSVQLLALMIDLQG